MKKHLVMARNLAHLLDSNFSVFGFRFGLDPLLGLIPGLGDLISFVLAIYIVWIATEMRVPPPIITKMWSNIILDLIVGLVPIVGDLADFAFKANTKNIKLLEKYTSVTVIDGQIAS